MRDSECSECNAEFLQYRCDLIKRLRVGSQQALVFGNSLDGQVHSGGEQTQVSATWVVRGFPERKLKTMLRQQCSQFSECAGGSNGAVDEVHSVEKSVRVSQRQTRVRKQARVVGREGLDQGSLKKTAQIPKCALLSLVLQGQLPRRSKTLQEIMQNQRLIMRQGENYRRQGGHWNSIGVNRGLDHKIRSRIFCCGAARDGAKHQLQSMLVADVRSSSHQSPPIRFLCRFKLPVSSEMISPAAWMIWLGVKPQWRISR